jgi:hypothetical protein
MLAVLVFGAPAESFAQTFGNRTRSKAATKRHPLAKPNHSLADLMNGSDAPTVPADTPMVQVDEAKVQAAGIRKLVGKRLTLYTDLPADQEIDTLPEVFDQAFPQWCEYFGQDRAKLAAWRMAGFLIKDESRFTEAGLLPAEIPSFDNGFCRNSEMWLYEQASPYYRRHLLLHEGTHGFMMTVLGSAGPPWYMEGLAEMLATHRWRDGQLSLNYMPTSREECLRWGRIKLIEDDYAARQAKTLKVIVDRKWIGSAETNMYAWCWAAATLLDHHPRYQKRFRQLQQFVTQADLSARFYRLFASDWPQLAEEWQVYVANLDYGYDVARMAVDFAPGRPMKENRASVTVAADRGWQNSGVRLEAGVTYRLQASGRYQVADKPQVWWCEPGGVTIRYYRGRPLGLLLAAVHPDEPFTNGPSALIHPMDVGLDTALTPKQAGTLFLRINDSAGELGDNAGLLTVAVERVKGDKPRTKN